MKFWLQHLPLPLPSASAVEKKAEPVGEKKAELETKKTLVETKASVEQEEVPPSLLKTALVSLPQVQDPVVMKRLQERQAFEAKHLKELEESKKAEATARLEVELASKKVNEAQNKVIQRDEQDNAQGKREECMICVEK